MKIAFFDTKPYDIKAFSKYTSDYEFKFYETHLNPDTAKLATGCVGVCVFVNDIINKKVIDKLVKLKVQFVALRCAGYNNVDIKYATDKIKVVHVPAYSPYAVAEHTMGLILTSVRRIHKAYNRTRDFNFSLSGLTGHDLHGKTVGIIGTGKIGTIFADICNGFKTNVIAYDKRPSTNLSVTYTDLKTLLKESDIISLHCPLNKETYHIIDHKAIDIMKKGVTIVNTSRGALIDAEALLEGIKSRKIGAACLDVYEEEADLFFEDFSDNIIQDDVITRLISMPNVIVTSHQAFLTKEALDNIAEITMQNVEDIIIAGQSKNQLPKQ